MEALVVAARRHARELENEVREGEEIRVYGKPAEEPILGNNLQLPPREDIRPRPVLVDSMPCVRFSSITYIVFIQIGLCFTRIGTNIRTS